MSRITWLAMLFVIVGGAAGCADLSSAQAPDPSSVADVSKPGTVGRIRDIDVNEGFLLVEFPSGLMAVSVPKRDLSSYRVGDELRIDSAGRVIR